jgi:hypothetical protein
MKAEAAQTLAGSRASQIENFRAQAGSSGFGGGAEQSRLESGIRAESGRDLLSAIRELNWLNEQAKLQQQGIGAGLSSNLAGIEAGLTGDYARAELGRQYPAIPGISGVGSTPRWRYLNANGEIMVPVGGFSPAQHADALRERMEYRRGQGQNV